MIRPALRPVLFAALCLGTFVGCGRDEARVYQAPKDEPAAPLPGAPHAPFMEAAKAQGDASGGSVDAMARQTLPAEAVAGDASLPQWVVPQGWVVGAAGTMRKASFTAEGPYGSVLLVVTAFPGDVGGLTANVNRWRQQIGLPAVDEAAASASVEPMTRADGGALQVVHFVGEAQSTRAAIASVNGTSWFFKLSGPKAAVERERAAFDAFVRSLNFSAP